jgi:CheY-like chemotaxis protein
MRISQAADDAAQIVARMREFYRRDLDSDRLEAVNINRLVEDVVELTRPRWRDQAQRQGIAIDVDCQLDPIAPILVCNPSELREALTNVVFNAVDALPHGGAITLTTRLIAPPPSPGAGNAEQNVQIEVRDNGVGMDDKVRQHCLEPFFSTKIQSDGTGLGLAMVYGMVRRHDGSIEIESAPNQGTNVRLVFPVRQRATTSAPAPVPPSDSFRSLRILCIDDEPELRELMRDVLEAYHHKVTVAAGGKEGLEMFQSNLRGPAPYEMVITDLGMPDIDGRQVARSIKAESPRTPVIMLTGWGTMMKADKETNPEVDAVLSKPPRIQELNDLLQRISAKSAHSLS